MNQDVLFEIDHASKRFCRSLKRSLFYGVSDITRELTGARTEPCQLRKDEFWSVKDLSLQLKRGECLGVIGPNGAGKSTLLKMVCGLLKPDAGRIITRGRVGALIELGAGFNPVLTGRENVYVNGAVLGLTRQEIAARFDAIVEFAELGDFIDSPVQNYSSGMKVRLGFAVAVQMDPDLLLIDEVLAVGDVGFRAKCFNAIYRMMQTAAVVFVSHSMPQVSRICSDVLVLDRGVVRYQGKDVPAGIGAYYDCFPIEEQSTVVAGSGKASVEHFEFRSKDRQVVSEIAFGENLSATLEIRVLEIIENPDVSITIVNKELQEVVQCSSYYDEFLIDNNSGLIRLDVDLGDLFLNPSIYNICLTITTHGHGEVIYKHQKIQQLKVNGKNIGFSPVQIKGQWTQR